MVDWEISAGFNPNGGYNLDRGDESLIVAFRWEAIEIKSQSDAEGLPKFKDVEYVEIRQPGARDPLYDGPLKENHKERFKPRYLAWKENREIAREGLPLEQWPILGGARIKELKAVGVHTVQELANVPDSLLPRLGLFGAQTRQKAKDWIANAKDSGVLSSLRSENDKLKEQLEFQNKRLVYLEEQLKDFASAKHAVSNGPSAVPQIDIQNLVAQAVAQAMAVKTEPLQAKAKKKVVSKKKHTTPDEDLNEKGTSS